MLTEDEVQDLLAWVNATLNLAVTNGELQQAKYDAHYTLITNYIAFMGYAFLVWDHCITFADEVDFIWKKVAAMGRRVISLQKIMLSLFLFNRYFTPLAFIGNLVAYLAKWSPSHCKHFVRYEGACTAIALAVAELLLLVRVVGLYWDKRVVPAAIFVIWLAQQAVAIWLLTTGEDVKHKESFDRACTMIFNPSIGKFPPSLSAWLPLLYDTVVVLCVLYKCLPQKKTSKSHILDTLIKDGIVYYGVLFSVNFVLGVMIIAAPDAIKNITAQLEQLLTVAMISRITLSLQREGKQGMAHDDDGSVHEVMEPRNRENIELAARHPGRERRRNAKTVRGHTRPTAPDVTTGQSIGSRTRIEHISVVTGSPLTQSLHTHAGDLGLDSIAESTETRVQPPAMDSNSGDRNRRGRGNGNRSRSSEEQASNDGAASVATAGVAESLGVISISPRHTDQAAEAAGRNMAGSQLWAHELRTMRPAALPEERAT